MRTYGTIMYAENLEQSEFWLGEVDSNGVITSYTNFKLSRPNRMLMDENVMYYVQVRELESDIDVHVAQWYTAIPKEENPKHYTVAEMAREGMLNPIEVGNWLLDLHRPHRAN